LSFARTADTAARLWGLLLIAIGAWFFAEITRLSEIVAMARRRAVDPLAPGVLFLLDEMLAGTNSHDRRIGAEAIVRALVEAGAIGLVTTHDLALTELVTALESAEV